MSRWAINWDNGVEACGTFPWVFDTEEAAQAYADDLYADNIARDVWREDDDPGVEVIELEDEEEPEDEMELLRKAALSNGQP